MGRRDRISKRAAFGRALEGEEDCVSTTISFLGFGRSCDPKALENIEIVWAISIPEEVYQREISTIRPPSRHVEERPPKRSRRLARGREVNAASFQEKSMQGEKPAWVRQLAIAKAETFAKLSAEERAEMAATAEERKPRRIALLQRSHAGESCPSAGHLL
jgi:hypothetical protein